MSVESAKLFITEMKNNPEFRAKFENAKSDGERKNVAKTLGYDFSKEEAMQAVSSSVDLSEEDLEKVAGGKSAAWIGVVIGALHP